MTPEFNRFFRALGYAPSEAANFIQAATALASVGATTEDLLTFARMKATGRVSYGDLASLGIDAESA